MPGSRAVAAGMLGLSSCVLALSLPLQARADGSVSAASARLCTRAGASSVAEAHSGSLLVDYFREFLGDRDLEAFRNRVLARYSEATLDRVLAASRDVTARRAAVLSLALLGSFQESNTVLGKALGDDDVAVRTMAQDALWAIWFRAGTPEHNRMLTQVRIKISREQLEQAEVMATRLISSAPDFAEAYNQRAIVYFQQGRFAESVADCEQVLKLNPYHFGAISGMAQCQLELGRPHDALVTLRRALKLQPHHTALRGRIRMLEAQTEPDSPR